MRSLAPVQKGSVFFAPMEGITDDVFRTIIQKLYPEWDVLATDFLRVPAAGRYPVKHLIKHLGKEIFPDQALKEKTMYQILTAHNAFTTELVQDLEALEIPWLDLNLGCPSGTVCKNQGGSFLLTNLTTLRPLVRRIRDNFKGRFTAKIRIGYHNTDEFEDSIRLLNDEGVEMITVHGRTRDMMYKEPARWEFIAKAVQISQVPIIGNGDTWKTDDIRRMLDETGCHGVMVARGALKSPWMAQDYHRGIFEETSSERIAKIKNFFTEYRAGIENDAISARGLHRQSKSVCRYMFDGVDDGEAIRRKLLISQTVTEFFDILNAL